MPNGNFNIVEASKMVTETVENMKTIIALGREEYFLNKFGQIFEYKFRTTLNKQFLRALFFAISFSNLIFLQAACFRRSAAAAVA